MNSLLFPISISRSCSPHRCSNRRAFSPRPRESPRRSNLRTFSKISTEKPRAFIAIAAAQPPRPAPTIITRFGDRLDAFMDILETDYLSEVQTWYYETLDGRKITGICRSIDNRIRQKTDIEVLKINNPGARRNSPPRNWKLPIRDTENLPTGSLRK